MSSVKQDEINLQKKNMLQMLFTTYFLILFKFIHHKKNLQVVDSNKKKRKHIGQYFPCEMSSSQQQRATAVKNSSAARKFLSVRSSF